jgi:flagellar hook protein FlgE
MSFQQGLSGLNAAAKSLDVTGNNIANSATVGFKTAKAHFSDVYAASLTGADSASVGIGTEMSAIQQEFSQGNISTSNNPLDIAISGSGFFRMVDDGNVTYSRAGQFHLDNQGFIVDDKLRNLTGYKVDALGKILKTSPESLQLSSSSQQPIATGASASELGVKASVNLDSRMPVKDIVFDMKDPDSYNFTTATTIYDSLGNAHTLSMFARREDVVGASPIATQNALDATDAAVLATAAAAALPRGTEAEIAASDTAIAKAAVDTAAAVTATADAANVAAAAVVSAAAEAALAAAKAAVPQDPVAIAAAEQAVIDADQAAAVFGSQWSIYTSVDGTAVSNVAGNPGLLTFNASGNLIKRDEPNLENGNLNLSIDLNKVMTGLGLKNLATSPQEFALNFVGSTQYGATSGTNSMLQDGYTSGRLTGVSVSSDGIIRGSYSNGQGKDLGQLALAGFTNMTGLASLGGNQWAETTASGAAQVGPPNTGVLGVLQSAAVEESNVDLTAELVSMITQQRNYQANAQSIKTQDQVTQTIVNLR